MTAPNPAAPTAKERLRNPIGRFATEQRSAADLGDVDIVDAQDPADSDPRWAELGISETERKMWAIDRGKTPDEAKPWIDRGFTSVTSVPWERHEFPPEEAQFWQSHVFSSWEARDWLDDGMPRPVAEDQAKLEAMYPDPLEDRYPPSPADSAKR